MPAGEAAAVIPKGEFGVYLSGWLNKPYRAKIRAPGFAFAGDGLYLQGPPAGRRFCNHGTMDIVFGRLLLMLPSAQEQPASFEFTRPIWLGRKGTAKYPAGRQASAVSVAVAGRNSMLVDPSGD